MHKYGKILERTKFDPNEIIIRDGYAEIVLYNKQQEETGRALIDIDDIPRVIKYKWYISNNGYVVAQNATVILHRLITNCPDNLCVDHIFHNKLDNRKKMLRTCTVQENGRNRQQQANNTSGVKGVHWDSRKELWVASIRINSALTVLGRFSDIKDAINIRNEAEIKYFGDFRFDEDGDDL